ncbi:hypothetical protein BHE74_00028620 [Ensete ventricosum]|nr:hypothetical protein BHE74_00028620 [Ensete ventricosum]
MQKKQRPATINAWDLPSARKASREDPFRGGENDRVNNEPAQLTRDHASSAATPAPKGETRRCRLDSHINIQGGTVRTGVPTGLPLRAINVA